MSIPLVVDMNLSVEWIDELAPHGWTAVHWSTIGDPRAEDSVVMAWARANGHAVFTHDLDFGTMLALTHASGPSVIQVRGQNVLPEHMGPLLLAALLESRRWVAVAPNRYRVSKFKSLQITAINLFLPSSFIARLTPPALSTGSKCRPEPSITPTMKKLFA